jgi:hypothetical protein
MATDEGSAVAPGLRSTASVPITDDSQIAKKLCERARLQSCRKAMQNSRVSALRDTLCVTSELPVIRPITKSPPE